MQGTISMSNHVINVPDLSCGHCVATVTTVLAGIPGLSESRIDLRQKRVQFRLADDTDLATAMQRLREAGYPAQNLAG